MKIQHHRKQGHSEGWGSWNRFSSSAWSRHFPIGTGWLRNEFYSHSPNHKSQAYLNMHRDSYAFNGHALSWKLALS